MTPEPILESAPPAVQVIDQPLEDSDSSNDSVAATAPAPDIDLLVESPGNYIPELQLISSVSSATTPYRAATAAYNLRTLSDDLLTGSDDYPNDDLGILVSDDNPFPDILAESLVTVPL